MQSQHLNLNQQSQGRYYREDQFRGSYGSPKNAYSRARESYLSPGEKYPMSLKYTPPGPIPRPLPQFPSYQYESDPTQVSDLRLSISQLKHSLQMANQNAQRLQQELFSQRKHTYELTQVRQRLQEELERVEFQLERMGNYENLEGREASIKLETALRENSRLSHQIADLQEENRGIKQDQRKLMTQIDQLIHERAALAGDNQQLSLRFRELEKEIAQVRKEFDSRESNIFRGPTHRSQHVPTIAGSANSIPLQPLQEVDYELQSQKLLQDYQQLMVQNQSMKRLHQQFYKNQAQNQSSLFKQQKHQRRHQQQPVSFHQKEDEEIARSFSNHHIAQRLNSERSSDGKASPMFKTAQNQLLQEELERTRGEAVEEVMKCYVRAVQQAEKEKKNALKLFMQDLSKNENIYAKMAQNYLEMRVTVKEEAGVDLPKTVEGLTGQASQAFQMYKSVKDKAKGEGGSGLAVAVFRLVTLMTRCKNIPAILTQNMQHSCLKYIYKMSSTPSNS